MLRVARWFGLAVVAPSAASAARISREASQASPYALFQPRFRELARDGIPVWVAECHTTDPARPKHVARALCDVLDEAEKSGLSAEMLSELAHYNRRDQLAEAQHQLELEPHCSSPGHQAECVDYAVRRLGSDVPEDVQELRARLEKVSIRFVNYEDPLGRMGNQRIVEAVARPRRESGLQLISTGYGHAIDWLTPDRQGASPWRGRISRLPDSWSKLPANQLAESLGGYFRAVAVAPVALFLPASVFETMDEFSSLAPGATRKAAIDFFLGQGFLVEGPRGSHGSLLITPTPRATRAAEAVDAMVLAAAMPPVDPKDL